MTTTHTDDMLMARWNAATVRGYLLAATLVLAGPHSNLALADLLTVVNPSFEAQILSDGGFSVGSPTGWTATNFTGIFNPATAHFPGEAPDGFNTAFSNGGDISQTLNSAVTENTAYTLLVEVGNRLDLPFPLYRVQLLADGVLLAEDNNSLSPGNGEFLTSTVEFEALAGNPSLGGTLEIRLRGTGTQTNFDNVRLDATTIPEPSALSLLAMVASGWAASRFIRSTCS